MSYLGQTTLKASDIRRVDVTSSTSATHTLTWEAPNEQSLIVTINGVKQQNNYTVSGTTLTLDTALVATDALEVIGINDIGTTITPAEGSVNTAQLANNVFSTAKIQDDAVTAAKLAPGLANATHTGDVTGATALTIAAGAVTSDKTTVGPAFLAQATSNQALTSGAYVKIEFDTELYDVDGVYDNTTNYRFTVPSGEAGYYWMYSTARIANATLAKLDYAVLMLYKNGTIYSHSNFDYRTNPGGLATPYYGLMLNCIVGDYFEMYARIGSPDGSAGSTYTAASRLDTIFGAWKVGVQYGNYSKRIGTTWVYQ